MLKNYDFSKSIKNPYIKKLKKQVTIRLENDTIDYFKTIAADADIPYQKLINLFLRDCAETHKKPGIHWKSQRKHAA
jgi:predicted DNA binding CopG/RHH family protein